MAERREVVGRKISDEEVIRLLLKEEEPTLVAPPQRPGGVPIGSIGLAMEEIDPGSVGIAVFPGVGALEVEALELVHIYANVLVVVEPNIVKEYGAVSSTIKAPSRSVEDVNDVAASIDVTITVERQVDVLTLLGGRVPRLIRILVDQDCTLEFSTPRTKRTAYPEELRANAVLVLENEAWTAFFVIPTQSTALKVYMSTSSAIGAE